MPDTTPDTDTHTDTDTDRTSAGHTVADGQPRPRAVRMRTQPHAGAAAPTGAQVPFVMPRDFSISLAETGAPDAAINEPGRRERRQEMAGYEDTFSDIIDFILRATHRIWEEKAIGYLYEHYSANVRVHGDSGTTYGREPVIAGTTQMIAAFPDLRILADEIIWCGDGAGGFWTSHRVMLVGRNTGWSEWGPPTGRTIAVRCIADCRSTRNQIVEEFVIYNTASIVAQLGYDVRELARVERARRLAAGTAIPEGSGEITRLLGQGRPTRPLDETDAPFDIEQFVGATFDEIWNWRLLDRINRSYASHLRFHGPTDREMYGVGEYTAWVLALLAMFPDAALQLDNVQWMGNDEEGYLVSVRWHRIGTHTGNGFFGPPTGRPVSMWGITHQRVVGGRIVEEWTVDNEFDVLVQLAADPD